jgi:hypothetical protein
MGAKFEVGVNDLATKRPDLVAEWSEKNTYSPSEVAYGSARPAVWDCKTCGQEWITLVSTRARAKGSGCPMCVKRAQRAKFAVK